MAIVYVIKDMKYSPYIYAKYNAGQGNQTDDIKDAVLYGTYKQAERQNKVLKGTIQKVEIKEVGTI